MANRRSEILETAKKLFAQRSYHTVTLEDVSKVLKMGKSTLYHYFSTKEDLFSQMISENIAAFYAYLEERISQKTTPEEKLRELVASLLEYFEENRDFFLITVREKVDFLNIKIIESGIDETIRTSLDDSIRKFSSIIDEGKRQGIFAEVDNMVIFSSVVGTVTALAFDVVAHKKDTRLTDMIDDCWRVIRGGILA